MMLGRNDPCPCGSGKKYKKCHGALAPTSAVASPAVRRASALKALDVELGKDLLRFARSHFGPDWLAGAFDVYLDGDARKVSDAELEIAIPWVTLSMPTEVDGLTLAELWRRERGHRASSDERLLLDAYASSWLSVWEVNSIERGVGSSLIDLLTGEKRFVYDVSSSNTLGPRDALLASVLDCGDVSFFCGVHGQPLPPREVDDVLREARKLCGVRTRAVAVDKLRDPTMRLDLVSLWNARVDVMLRRPAPTLQNTDGDAFVLTRDDFELIAPQSDVARHLEMLEGAGPAEPKDDGIVFVVTKPGNAKQRDWDNTIIGRIVVGPRRLFVESNSTRRADALRDTVSAHLEGMVRFRVRTESNTLDMLEQARASVASGGQREPTPMSPEEVALVREFRERHLKSWVDDSIPALGGLTPRQAASVPAARRKLDVLVKEIERSEARLPADERIDVSWLRTSLQLGS